MNIDWEKAADGTAVEIRQGKRTGNMYFFNAENKFWKTNIEEWRGPVHPENYMTVIKRPKPPLAYEQIRAVREYDEWLSGQTDRCFVDRWLEGRSE